MPKIKYNTDEERHEAEKKLKLAYYYRNREARLAWQAEYDKKKRQEIEDKLARLAELEKQFATLQA